MERLSDGEVAEAVSSMPGWSAEGGRLHKDFEFQSFNEAFGFMARASMEIEKMDHHPEWRNVYNRLSVDLTTHDAGGITANDVALARILDSLRG